MTNIKLFFGNWKRVAWSEDAQDGADQGRREGVCSAREAKRASSRNLVLLRRERSRTTPSDRIGRWHVLS
jgi:hypothetical protein